MSCLDIDDMEQDEESALKPNTAVPHITADDEAEELEEVLGGGVAVKRVRVTTTKIVRVKTYMRVRVTKTAVVAGRRKRQQQRDKAGSELG